MTESEKLPTWQKLATALDDLGYNPTTTEYGLQFTLVDKVNSDLIISQWLPERIEFSLLSHFPVSAHDDVDLFTLTVSPYLTPVRITAVKSTVLKSTPLKSTVNLQLDVKADDASVVSLLTESLVLMKQMLRVVGLEIVQLTQHECDLPTAFGRVLERLHQPGEAEA